MKFITSWLLVTVCAFSNFAQDFEGAEDYEAMSKKAESAATEDGRKVLETGRVMTLVNAEILPGGCWDYANAVYDRAGYASGKRETVYKTVKAGPYADIGTIQYGDWLYYVNHSYGDIEHSAIFVDWINQEQKIGLMLSYGGESRREPARYLPYDLSSVYGITRPNGKVGEKKPSTKTNTSISTVDKNKDNTSKAKDTLKSVSSNEVSGVMASGMKVEALKFGLNVQKMEVIGEGTTFLTSDGKVYCWMKVSGGQGKFVKIKWYWNGNLLGDVQLDLKYNPMRTYAYRTVSGRAGAWQVEVEDPSGTVMHSAKFTVR